MKLITAALLLGAVSAVSGKTSNLRSSRQLQDEVVYGTYLEADIQYADHSDGHLDAIALPDGTILDIEDADDADDDVKTRGHGWFRKHGYESGITQIALTGRVEGGKLKLEKLPQVKALAKGKDKDKRSLEEDRRRLQQPVTKTVLALRVEAADATTSSSAAVISDKIFGTSGDSVNLKSQYAACSHGKLIFEPATGNGIDGGVSTVSIQNTVAGAENGVIRDAVTNAGNIKFGNMQNQFDYVMQCLPPGTNGGWIAYAYINWYLSVYNDLWCNYPSGQMHEIGHNLGLAHSGETATYDDQSGMMGYSYGSDETPKMCFNAAKNFQLGWFNDKFVTVDSTNAYWSGDLLGQVNYDPDPDSEDQRVGIKIAEITDSTGSTHDYYVSFNLRAGHNIETQEGANQVLVHRRDTGDGYAESTLLKKLNAGGSYAIPNFGPISVNTIDLLATPAFATVTIGNPPPTPAPVVPPTPAPIAPPTPAPIVPPTPAPVVPPTPAPVVPPTPAPVVPPTPAPVVPPTPAPVVPPTPAPVVPPTPAPVVPPTPAPVVPPTPAPVVPPTPAPVVPPTPAPVVPPTPAPVVPPTPAPVVPPTPAPVAPPTPAPVVPPTPAPVVPPTPAPVAPPTPAPVVPPTPAPVVPTKAPTEAPTSPFSCEATYSIKDTCNPDARCFWGTKSSCSPTNSGNTARNKCCPSSGGPTPSPPPTPSPGPGPGPGPGPATCGEIPDNGTCKATSGCRWSKGSCVDGSGGAEFCFGKNGSCGKDSECCSGSCKGNGRCE